MQTASKLFNPGICGYTIIFMLAAFMPNLLAAQTGDEGAIRQLLSTQTKAWNQGNVNEFMHGYWNSDSLLFIGKAGPAYGYTTTLNNYKKHYPDTVAMGKLAFTLLRVKRLSPQYYYVTGKWHLHRKAGDVEGYFTLLFEKIRNTWVIIEDHSS